MRCAESEQRRRSIPLPESEFAFSEDRMRSHLQSTINNSESRTDPPPRQKNGPLRRGPAPAAIYVMKLPNLSNRTENERDDNVANAHFGKHYKRANCGSTGPPDVSKTQPAHFLSLKGKEPMAIILEVVCYASSGPQVPETQTSHLWSRVRRSHLNFQRAETSLLA